MLKVYSKDFYYHFLLPIQKLCKTLKFRSSTRQSCKGLQLDFFGFKKNWDLIQGANMIMTLQPCNATKEGKITFDNLKNNENACQNHVGDCDWLQNVINQKSMIFMVAKNTHFLSHDILYYYLNIRIIIVDETVILKIFQVL